MGRGRISSLITVGVPVYNGERYLRETLESLLAQTFPDFLVFVGDNASDDGTEDIGREFARLDNRVRYIRHPVNLGAAENYNELFRRAETELFRWAAADDPSEPRYLEACLEALRANEDAVLAYPQVMLIDSESKRLQQYDEGLHLPQSNPGERFLELLRNTKLCNAVYGLARTEAIGRTRLMGSYIGSDVVFQAELALYGKFIEVPEVLLLRRMHDDSSTSMTDEELVNFYFPQRSSRTAAYHWRQLYENIHSLMRAPIKTAERFHALRGLIQRAAWNRSALWNEVKLGIGSLFGRTGS
jgi:GT2 family glycosyltransferase